MCLQSIAVLTARLPAAEARKTQPSGPDTCLLEQLRQQHDRLRVDRGILRAERLGADLPELPIAPGLRALVAEEARQVPELHRLAPLVHAVFHICPAYRRGSLRAKRQRAARA